MNPVVRRIFKWLFILGLISAAGFWALGAAGGKSDDHRGVIEDYLQDISGMTVGIERLNGLYFFPSILVDFEGLKMAEEEGGRAVTLDVLHMGVGFKDAMFRSGKFSVLRVQNFTAAAGTVMAEALHIETLGIEHTSETSAFLTGGGTIGQRAFTIKTPLLIYGKSGAHKYRFDADFPVILVMENGERFGVDLQDGQMILEPEL